MPMALQPALESLLQWRAADSIIPGTTDRRGAMHFGIPEAGKPLR